MDINLFQYISIRAGIAFFISFFGKPFHILDQVRTIYCLCMFEKINFCITVLYCMTTLLIFLKKKEKVDQKSNLLYIADSYYQSTFTIKT